MTGPVLTPEVEAIVEAFGEPVLAAGLGVRTIEGVKPLLARVEVFDPRRSGHSVAVFEIADNEYVGIRLDNGAHFWEHEWAHPFQKAFASVLGAAVAEHVAGTGTFDGGRYTITIGEEVLRTRNLVDHSRIPKP